MFFFRRLKRLIFGHKGVRIKLDEQIWFLKCAIERSKHELQRMCDCWERSKGACCPACMFGYEFTYWCDKLDRQEKMLQVLYNRRSIRDDLGKNFHGYHESLKTRKHIQ